MKVILVDRIIYKGFNFHKRYKHIITSTSLAFLGGMFVNTLSAPELSFSFEEIVYNVFSTTKRPLNILSWVSLFLVSVVPLLSYFYKKYNQKRGLLERFTQLLEKNISRSIREFSHGYIAWSTSLTMLQAPDLKEGWSLSNIQVLLDAKVFSMPSKYKSDYAKYFKKNFKEKGFNNDGVKYMLKNNPSSFTDAPTLTLDLIKCKFSEIQYYRDVIAPQSSTTNKLLRKIYKENKVQFPHALCLHLAIITTDQKILLTKRSEKVSYYPSSWSVSSEEQLHPLDFATDNNHALESSVDRLFEEEIGKLNDIYNIDNFKILSVFIETDILNVSLAGILKLNIDSKELAKSIRNTPRKDYEFGDFEFKSFSEIMEIFKNPKIPLHASAGYRILLVLYNKYGPIELINYMLKM